MTIPPGGGFDHSYLWRVTPVTPVRRPRTIGENVVADSEETRARALEIRRARAAQAAKSQSKATPPAAEPRAITCPVEPNSRTLTLVVGALFVLALLFMLILVCVAAL